MMRPLLVLLVAGLAVSAARAVETSPPAPTPTPAQAAMATSFPPEIFAAVGASFAFSNHLPDMGWSAAQAEAFVAGMRAAFQHKVPPPDARTQALNRAILARLQELEEGDAQAARRYFADPAHRESFFKDACRQFQLERTDSGLAYRLLTQGGNVRPLPEDRVVVSYKVTTPDGKAELANLGVTNQSVAVSDLLPGLAEAVQMIGAGDAVMLVLPPELSYGEGPWPEGVERGLPLIFILELKQILPASGKTAKP